jgi:hypothetical protein
MSRTTRIIDEIYEQDERNLLVIKEKEKRSETNLCEKLTTTKNDSIIVKKEVTYT